MFQSSVRVGFLRLHFVRNHPSSRFLTHLIHISLLEEHRDRMFSWD